MMNQTQLLYFLEVYQCRNITRAAEKLHISRQSLSGCIRDLEHKINVSLFERSKYGLTPTEYAISLSKHAQTIKNEYDQIMCQCDSKAKEHHLRIYATSMLLELLPTEFYEKFISLYPDILLELQELSIMQAFDSLRQKRCDFILTTDSIDFSDFTWKFLFHVKYVALVNKKNPLAQKECIRLKDLQHEKIIGNSKELHYLLNESNYTFNSDFPFQMILDTSNTTLTRRLTKENKGIALLWDYGMYNRELLDDDLVILPLYERFWGTNIYLVENKNNSIDVNKSKFKEYLLNYTKHH